MTAPRALPHSIQMEHALLGAIMVNNDAFYQVASFLQAHDFFEPLHAKIYELAANLIREGSVANPLKLTPYLPPDLNIHGLTGSQYLARLAAEATTIINAADYGRTIQGFAVRRQAIAIAEDLIAAAHLPEKAGFVEGALDALAELVTSSAAYVNTMRTAGAAATELVEHVGMLFQDPTADDAVKTGLRDFDEHIGGFPRGGLIVLAGRPGMGKTSLAGAIALNAAKRGHGVAFFSLEMPSRQIMARMVADQLYGTRTPIDVRRLLKAEISEADFNQIVDAARELEKLPLIIDDAPNATIGTLLAKTQVAASRLGRTNHKLDLICVDYLKFISAGDRYAGQRTYEVGEITKGLKQIARRRNAVVLLCAQLNRQVEARPDKRPQLADLRESGDIEADADQVLLLFREAYYLQNDPALSTDAQKLRRLEQVEFLLEIIVGKNRLGPTSTIKASIDLPFSAIRDLARDAP